MASYNGEVIRYDASGNPTTYLGQSLSWNGLQLTGVGGNISYSYDKDGIRQTKTVGTAITQYYYNGNVLMGTYDGTNKLLSAMTSKAMSSLWITTAPIITICAMVRVAL